MRLETVAKKNPKTTINKAPINGTGIEGTSQINKAIIKLPIKTYIIGKSFSVLDEESPDFPKPLIAFAKVLIINGRDFTKLKIPPAATAPAPM